jgi:putative ABC transport system ATP-binding protein
MLSINSLTKSYQLSALQKNLVFEELDLIVDTGEFAVLLGSNGSGKSTLLKIIAGFVPADEGQIKIDALNVTHLPAFKRANSIYYLHQTRDLNLSPSLTLLEIFMIGLSNAYGILKILNRKEWRYRIIHLLSEYELGLENKIDQQIKSLSGGEHQLIALILIVERIKYSSNRMSILLLDEHTAHLDAQMADLVIKKTNELIVKYNITTLMVTHDLFIAKTYGDKTYLLRNKKIVSIVKGDIMKLFGQHEQ